MKYHVNFYGAENVDKYEKKSKSSEETLEKLRAFINEKGGIVKKERLDRNDFKAAVQSYIADTDKDISVLMDYARARRVVKKVQSFIGVWL